MQKSKEKEATVKKNVIVSRSQKILQLSLEKEQNEGRKEGKNFPVIK